MKLFLASEGAHPESLQKADVFVGGFAGKRLAYIPTAANGMRWGIWQKGESWHKVQTLGAKLELIQLEDFGTPAVIDRIKDAEIIWVAGGFCGYLMYWMRRCGLDVALPNILKSGAIYLGSSAGSMIAGHDLQVAEWLIGDSEAGANIFPSLKLVDFNIYPHFEEAQLPQIKKLNRADKLYLLKDGEAIIVEDKKIEIIGKERIA